MLVLLDNLEHLPEAVTVVADLVGACPGLTVLATSRAPLRLTGERQFPLRPLSSDEANVPDIGGRPGAVRGRRALPPAGQGRRARLRAHGCERGHGGADLPQARRVAAGDRACGRQGQAVLAESVARTAGSRPAAPRGRGARPAGTPTDAARHGGLELRPPRRGRAGCCSGASPRSPATFPWRRRRPSVGPSGRARSWRALASLVDNSLLVPRAEASVDQEDDEPRFAMLETIREYAAERLESSGEAEEVRRAHALYYLALAEATQPEILVHTQQEWWWTRLEEDHDNLRAALRWAIRSREEDTAARLALALWRFWSARHLSEGCRWLEAVLALDESTEGRAAGAQAGVSAPRGGYPDNKTRRLRPRGRAGRGEPGPCIGIWATERARMVRCASWGP